MTNDDIDKISEAVKGIRSTLKCVHCLSFSTKVKTSRCGHLFCYDCIKTLMQQQRSTCPACMKSLDQHSMRRSEYVDKVIADSKLLIDAIQLDAGIKFDWSESKGTKPVGQRRSNSAVQGSSSDVASLKNQSSSSTRGRATSRLRKKETTPSESENVESLRSENTSRSINVGPAKRNQRLRGKVNKVMEEDSNKVSLMDENITDAISVVASVEKVSEWLNSEEFVRKSDDEDYLADKLSTKKIPEATDAGDGDLKYKSFTFAKKDCHPTSKKQGTTESKISPAEAISRTKETWSKLALLKKEMRPKTKRRRRLDINIEQLHNTKNSNESTRQETMESDAEIEAIDSNDESRVETVAQSKKQIASAAEKPVITCDVTVHESNSMNIDELNRNQLKEIIGVNALPGDLNCSKSSLNSSGNLSPKSNKFRLSLQHRNNLERSEPSPVKGLSPNKRHETLNPSNGCPPKSIRLSVSRKSTPTKHSPLKFDAEETIAEQEIPADIPVGKAQEKSPEKKLDRLLPTTKTSAKELQEASVPRTLPSDHSKVNECVSAASSDYQSSLRFQSSKTRSVTMKKLGRLFKPRNKVKFLWHRSMKSQFSGNRLRLRSIDAITTTKMHHRLSNSTDTSVRSVETQTDESTFRCNCSIRSKKTPEKICSAVETSSFRRMDSMGIQDSNKTVTRARTSSNVNLLSPQQDSQLKFLSNESPADEGIRKGLGSKKTPSRTLTVSSESGSEKVDEILKSEKIIQNAKQLAAVLLKTDSEDMVGTDDEKRKSNGNFRKDIVKKKSMDSLNCEKPPSKIKGSLENDDSKKTPQKRKRVKGSAKIGKNITISSSSESDKDASTIINRSIENHGTGRKSERSDNSAAERQKVVRKLNYSPELDENQESTATDQKKKFSRIRRYSSSDSDNELIVSLPSRKSSQSANIVSRANSSRSLSKHDRAGNISVQFTSNMETQESKRKRSLSPDSLDIQQIVTKWRDELTDSEPVNEPNKQTNKHEVPPMKKARRPELNTDVTDSDNKSTVILQRSDEENFPVLSPTAIHGVEHKNFSSVKRDPSKLLAISGASGKNSKSNAQVSSPAKSNRTILSDCYRGAFEDNFDEALAKLDETIEHSKNEPKNRTHSLTGSPIRSARRGSTETMKSFNRSQAALSEKLSRDVDKQNKLSNNFDIGCINSEDFMDSMSLPSRRESDAGRNVCRSRSSLKVGQEPENVEEIAGKIDCDQFEKSFNSEHLNITQEEILFREIEGNLLGRKKSTNLTKSSPRKSEIPDVEASKVANASEKIEEAGKIAKVNPIDGGIFSDEDIVESTPKKKSLAKKDLQDMSRASPCSVVSRKSLLLRDTTPIARAKSALVQKTLDISPIVEPSSSKLSSASLKEQQVSKLHQSTPKSLKDKMESNPLQMEKKLCFVCTGLLPDQVNKVKIFAREINASYVMDYKPEVTHVIVKTDENSNGAAITIKYLFGIVNKKWIVSYQWVVDCSEQKKLLDEERYEVVDDDTREPGPQRSRLSTTGLFDLFTFLCIEPFLFLKPSQLQQLLVTAGGTMVYTLEALAAQSDKYKVLLYQTESHDTTVVQKWYNEFRVLPVSVEWITDSISQYCLCPLSMYLPSENPDYALVLGFPPKLVIDDEEYDTTMDVTS